MEPRDGGGTQVEMMDSIKLGFGAAAIGLTAGTFLTAQASGKPEGQSHWTPRKSVNGASIGSGAIVGVFGGLMAMDGSPKVGATMAGLGAGIVLGSILGTGIGGILDWKPGYMP
jgi:hypothetical protein